MKKIITMVDDQVFYVDKPEEIKTLEQITKYIQSQYLGEKEMVVIAHYDEILEQTLKIPVMYNGTPYTVSSEMWKTIHSLKGSLTQEGFYKIFLKDAQIEVGDPRDFVERQIIQRQLKKLFDN